MGMWQAWEWREERRREETQSRGERASIYRTKERMRKLIRSECRRGEGPGHQGRIANKNTAGETIIDMINPYCIG